MKTHLRVVRAGAPKADRWQWRLIAVFDWMASVHWVIYQLLVVAFLWWLAFGHK
jgi:hypothetical protein